MALLAGVSDPVIAKMKPLPFYTLCGRCRAANADVLCEMNVVPGVFLKSLEKMIDDYTWSNYS